MNLGVHRHAHWCCRLVLLVDTIYKMFIIKVQSSLSIEKNCLKDCVHTLLLICLYYYVSITVFDNIYLFKSNKIMIISIHRVLIDVSTHEVEVIIHSKIFRSYTKNSNDSFFLRLKMKKIEYFILSFLIYICFKNIKVKRIKIRKTKLLLYLNESWLFGLNTIFVSKKKINVISNTSATYYYRYYMHVLYQGCQIHGPHARDENILKIRLIEYNIFHDGTTIENKKRNN
ncbi:hypothetical protein AGLY_001803 [Aphis glycines]|uniref:Uncharacterized protein n=1 Tax=Aphis glycines TaxID=307491 RepID=A0A6G0U4W0_APHGL|nr:hypothetical protein AGLY_001803 [Aphis glycines]